MLPLPFFLHWKGLTRDSIAIEWEWEGRQVQIADTAGIRRVSQRNHDDSIEDAAVQDAMRAMKKADVAVLVLNGEAQALHRQELAIASAVVRDHKTKIELNLVLHSEYQGSKLNCICISQVILMLRL